MQVLTKTPIFHVEELAGSSPGCACPWGSCFRLFPCSFLALIRLQTLEPQPTEATADLRGGKVKFAGRVSTSAQHPTCPEPAPGREQPKLDPQSPFRELH